ncbi:MAG: hypothetical protein ACT4PU_07150 [Planctomycetota bacterium]
MNTFEDALRTALQSLKFLHERHFGLAPTEQNELNMRLTQRAVEIVKSDPIAADAFKNFGRLVGVLIGLLPEEVRSMRTEAHCLRMHDHLVRQSGLLAVRYGYKPEQLAQARQAVLARQFQRLLNGGSIRRVLDNDGRLAIFLRVCLRNELIAQARSSSRRRAREAACAVLPNQAQLSPERSLECALSRDEALRLVMRVTSKLFKGGDCELFVDCFITNQLPVTDAELKRFEAGGRKLRELLESDRHIDFEDLLCAMCALRQLAQQPDGPILHDRRVVTETVGRITLFQRRHPRREFRRRVESLPKATRRFFDELIEGRSLEEMIREVVDECRQDNRLEGVISPIERHGAEACLARQFRRIKSKFPIGYAQIG